ncbi:MAG: hypothetical protein C4521_07520 [Actinobacteria bacterium]|nr:MAG: hypothetical protein C4521_07520 [Actinomycetota bacterium]
MADSVTSQTLFSGEKRVVMAFTSVSDSTGESAVQKVDISALPGSPAKVKINKVTYSVVGMSVSVLFDHMTDDRVLSLQGEGCLDFTPYGGVQDPSSAGGTGDILFTTNNATVGATYTIVLDLGLS